MLSDFLASLNTIPSIGKYSSMALHITKADGRIPAYPASLAVMVQADDLGCSNRMYREQMGFRSLL